MHNENRNRPAGLTLVEILVVITIITILMALLLPTLARARDTAMLTVCMSNLKNVYLGVTNYSNDYSRCLPPRKYYDSTNATKGQGYWAYCVELYLSGRTASAPEPEAGTNWGTDRKTWFETYIKNKGIFKCPARLGDNTKGNSDDCDGNSFSHYSINSLLSQAYISDTGGAYFDKGEYLGVSTSQYGPKKPEMIFMSEGGYAYDLYIWQPYAVGIYKDFKGNYGVEPYHFRKTTANYLLISGAVKSSETWHIPPSGGSATTSLAAGAGNMIPWRWKY